MNDSNGDIIIYQTEDGLTKINVKQYGYHNNRWQNCLVHQELIL